MTWTEAYLALAANNNDNTKDSVYGDVIMAQPSE